MNKHEDTVYLKEDSSIQGDGHRVEIVSHPHSFNELMKKDSWLDTISTLPTNNHEENGCHVHISRTAFEDDKHYGLFYFLIHSIEGIATKVGGRSLTGYCKMRPSGRIHNKANKRGDSGGDRSIFLNERGSQTVEARFFKGTTKTNELKSYVQLLESLIKYTRYHSKRVTIKGWFQYISQKSTKYKELLERVGDVTTHSEYDVIVTYKTPKRVRRGINKLTIVEMDCIIGIKLKDGTDIKVSKVNHVYIHTININQDEGYSNTDVSIKKIDYVLLEEV